MIATIEHHADAKTRKLDALVLDLAYFARWLQQDPTRLSLTLADAVAQFEGTPWRLAHQGQRIRTYGGHYCTIAHVSRLGRRIVFDTEEGRDCFIKAEDQIYRACGQASQDAITGLPCIFI